MSTLLAIVTVLALLGLVVWLCYWLGNLIETQGPPFRKSEVLGYRLLWHDYGWTGAQAHFQHWDGKKWITAHLCESVSKREFQHGTLEKVKELERKKVKEALTYLSSWGHTIHPPRTEDNA